MSSHFLRKPGVASLVAATLFIALGAGADTVKSTSSGSSTTRQERLAGKRGPAAQVYTVDDSSAAANELLTYTRGDYGGLDNFTAIAGARYYVTYTIPGPEGATVRTWTESHMVWFHERPRVRIDNATDSTVVVVTGDTTYVRRDGKWSSDSLVVAEGRAQAMDAHWFLHLPWNLLNPALKRRLDPPWVKDGPLGVRVEYAANQDRPAGTRMWVNFTPPTYAIRTLRWFDPRSQSWYLLELSQDQKRYQWTWAGHRTLRASDSDGKPGPVVLEAQIEDMQLESTMPNEVLSPPGGVAVVAR